MKRHILYSLMVLSLASPFLAGCDSQDNVDKNVSIADFTKTNDSFATKVNNDVETFSFISKVSVPNNYTWSLYYDFEATNEIVNKTIRCSLGNNRVYLLVYNQKDTLGFYSVDVYRYHMYSVNFNTNGGNYIQPQQVQEESLISPIENPTKKGYSFVSWDYDFNSPVTRNLTINASWSANRYTVTLNVNGGNPISKTTYELDFNQQYAFETPKYTGKTFVGWYFGTQLVPSSGRWAIDQNCELTAHWEVSQYTITYDPKGGNMDDLTPQIVLYGSEFILRTTSREGYTFKGWYYNSTQIESGVWNFENNLDLVAKWEANSYDVTFDYAGGEETQLQATYTYDSSFTLPNTSRTGYQFKGWYFGSQLVESGVWKIAQNIELKAHWEVISYSLNLSVFSSIFRQNDFDKYTVVYHEYGTATTSVEYRFGEQIELYEPSKTSNKYFAGWFTDQELSSPFVMKNGVSNKETNLFSRWDTRQSTFIPDGESREVNINDYSNSHVEYFFAPVSGKYKFDVHFDNVKVDYPSGNFMEALIVHNEDTKRNLESDHCYNYSDTVDLSAEVELTAGDYISINLSITNKYISLYNTSCVCSVTCIDECAINYDLEQYHIKVLYDSQFSCGIPEDIPSGKQFVGWFTDENGQGEMVTDKNGVSLNIWNFVQDKILYPYFD